MRFFSLIVVFACVAGLAFCDDNPKADKGKPEKAKVDQEKVPSQRSNLFRFYDKSRNEHVYTVGDDELADWRLREELINETVIGQVAFSKEPDTSPLYRAVRPDGKHYYYVKKPATVTDFKLEDFPVYIWTKPGEGRVPIHSCVLPDNIDLYLDSDQKKVFDFSSGTLKGIGVKRKNVSRLFYVYPAITEEGETKDEKAEERKSEGKEEETKPAEKKS